MKTEHHKHSHAEKEHKHHYWQLLIMVLISFVAMYILMYAMVDRFANVFSNVNQFYMAGLMSMPMLMIELALMGAMYKNKKLNLALFAVSGIALITFYLGIRQQFAVSDKQFLKSMIPHHAAAILMCEQAAIDDPEIKDLCRNIIRNQQAEIDQMKSKLTELKN